MNVLLILVSIMYSILALIYVYGIVVGKTLKRWLFVPILMEIVVILSIYLDKVSFMGIIPAICGVPFMIQRRKNKMKK